MLNLSAVPPPWLLKGVGWVFPTHLTPFSTTPIPLPAGSQAPLEAASPTGREQAARFHGGVGYVVVVRYTESPVGPYDELIWAPGCFSREESPNEYYSTITRIYVSSNESVINGRRNWNIPKHLATFTFTPTSSTRLTSLTVCNASSPTSSPFFNAILDSGSRFAPSLPVRTSWLSTSFSSYILSGRTFEFLQLPLPPLPHLALEGEETDTPTGETLRVVPVARSVAKLAGLRTVKGEEKGGYGDGVGFPEFEVYGGMGVRIDFGGKTGLTFPLPEVVDRGEGAKL